MKRKQKAVCINLLAIAVIIPVVFPVYWLVISALQSPESIISIPPSLFPHDFSPYFLKKVFTEMNIGQYLFNSIMLSVVSTFLTLFIACLAAFSPR